MKNTMLTSLLFAFGAAHAATPVPSEAPPPPPREDTLADCARLETAERGECELRVRQGFDDKESGSPQTPVPVQRTPPTDRVPPPEDAAADEDGDEG